MKLNAPKKITLESEKRISKVLIIADASSQALVPVLDSLQTLQRTSTVCQDHLSSLFFPKLLKRIWDPIFSAFWQERKQRHWLRQRNSLTEQISIVMQKW